MDIKSLRLFLGILKYGSITRAAGQLHIAQPALGIHLRNLEEELGCDLVHRHSRGVTPTEAGLLLAQHAEILLRQFNRAKQELVDFSKTARGSVVVGMAPSMIQAISAELLTAVRQKYPDISVIVTEALSGALLEWLKTDRIDLALSYSLPHDDEILSEALTTESIYFVYPADEVGKYPPEIPFSDVLDHPLILPTAGYTFRQMAERAAQQIGKPLKISVEMDSAVPARELVRAGIGYGLKPLGVIRWEVEAGLMGASRVVEPALERPLYLATLRHRPVTKAFDAVREILKETVVGTAETKNLGWRRHRGDSIDDAA